MSDGDTIEVSKPTVIQREELGCEQDGGGEGDEACSDELGKLNEGAETGRRRSRRAGLRSKEVSADKRTLKRGSNETHRSLQGGSTNG